MLSNLGATPRKFSFQPTQTFFWKVRAIQKCCQNNYSKRCHLLQTLPALGSRVCSVGLKTVFGIVFICKIHSIYISKLRYAYYIIMHITLLKHFFFLSNSVTVNIAFVLISGTLLHQYLYGNTVILEPGNLCTPLLTFLDPPLLQEWTPWCNQKFSSTCILGHF